MTVDHHKEKTRKNLARFASDIAGIVSREAEMADSGRVFPWSICPVFGPKIAGAIEKFLDSGKSIEHNLGLIRRGKPPNRTKYLIVAEEAEWRLMGGESLTEIFDDLISRGCIKSMDKKDFKEILARYHEDVVVRMSEKLAQALRGV